MDRDFFEEHGVLPLEGESPKAFRALLSYLRLPAESRSHVAAAEDGHSLGSISRWSRKFSWLDRARAFDSQIDTNGLSALLARRRALVNETIENSMTDSIALRKQLMRVLPSTVQPAELASLIAARMDLDSWRVEILEVLEGLDAQTQED